VKPRETKKLLEVDRELVMHPTSPLRTDVGWVVEEGKGMNLKDTDGKEYLEFASGLTCANLGYGCKELAEVAMAEMSKLGYYDTMDSIPNKPNIECAMKLKELTPEGINHFFFGSGGSDAVDSAVKIARLYWRCKGRGKHKIISLQNSYHGVTMGVTALTTMESGFGSIGVEPIIPGVVHAPYYYCYRCPFGWKYPDCNTACARYLEQIIDMEGEETVAAFIAEAVQGSGGQIVPPPTYWPVVRDICNKHNVLLIIDEVMTGFGRTGKMFAVEHWNLKPDILLMAKGITAAYFPVSATGITDEIFNTLAAGAPEITFPAGYTYSGHPVGMAIAVKTMEIYEKEKIVENSARVGKYMLDQLQGFKEFAHVGDIHGLGLFCGIDLVVDKVKKTKIAPLTVETIDKACHENGLIIRAFHSIIGLTPPLICTTKGVDRALSILKPIIANLKV
jgi:4-aminobutyrate--pyruvate transaminase